MGRIIIPDCCKPPDPEQLAKDKALQERYDSDPEVKKLADDIHHHRMMAGPACLGCIEMAVRRIDNPTLT